MGTLGGQAGLNNVGDVRSGGLEVPPALQRKTFVLAGY